jgi:hypothetical protein
MYNFESYRMDRGGMRTVALVLTITLFSADALAQGHGTAPNFFPPKQYTSTGAPSDDYYRLFFQINQYPMSYTGDVWTGTVTAIHGWQISLAWTNKKGKIETFTGQVGPSYTIPAPTREGTQTVSVWPPGQESVGKKMRVYYTTSANKVIVGGKKVKVTTNYIFRLEVVD